jgi:DNA-binding transcriptional ArsR family regulator
VGRKSRRKTGCNSALENKLVHRARNVYKIGLEMSEFTIWEVLLDHSATWLTNAEIFQFFREWGGETKARTIRFHTRRLVGLGVVDEVEAFPGNRYRISRDVDKVAEYGRRLSRGVCSFLRALPLSGDGRKAVSALPD